MILVDTCVLSEAFHKRTATSKFVKQLDFFRQMIADDWPIGIPGIVLQEFMTSFKNEKRFERARTLLDGFPVIVANEEDHLLAAKVRSLCFSKGVCAHGIDCLIASTSINRNHRLLTFDRDFQDIAKVCHLKLFKFDD